MIDEPGDAESGEYLSDTEMIDRLRREVEMLQVKVAVLENEIKRIDPWKLREEVAVLTARVDSLREYRAAVGSQLWWLSAVMLAVLASSVINLSITLTSLARP